MNTSKYDSYDYDWVLQFSYMYINTAYVFTISQMILATFNINSRFKVINSNLK